jgi:osmotically-inducible protein OsmY
MKNSDQLRSDVEQELAWEPRLDERHIMVGVNNGAVTLGGRVPTYSQKVQAVRAVERVAGVRAVADELQVRLAHSHVRDDTDIAESVAHLLAWNIVVLPDSIQAEVENGTVILRGLVETEFERGEAARLTRDVLGVRGVRNLVTLKARPTRRRSSVT